MKTINVLGIAIVSLVLAASAADTTDITLPLPRMEGGKPLLQVLKERQSSRLFSTKPLPVQMLSDLLWAAFGINRPETGKRTAPSARNWQEMEVYAIMAQGAYLYDAKANTLRLIAKGDLRKLAGTQDFVGTAPLNLVYAADLTKLKTATPEDQALCAANDVGFICQNVCLFCTSEGLATVVRGSVDKGTLATALNLSKEKKIMLAQTVGYPGGDAK
jgi:SagB-type dehydrogenase family enzyme